MPDDEEPMIKAVGGWCAPSGLEYTLGEPLSFDFADVLKRTPEEWAAINAERKTRVEAEFAIAERYYFQVHNEIVNHMAGSTQLRAALQSIAERHAPEAGSYGVECSCWHNSGYEVDSASWPCPDIKDVALAVGVTLPENDDGDS